MFAWMDQLPILAPTCSIRAKHNTCFRQRQCPSDIEDFDQPIRCTGDAHLWRAQVEEVTFAALIGPSKNIQLLIL